MSHGSTAISVATYNVLADRYIKPEYYPNCDPAHFAPAHRHPLLEERVSGLRTDVICLQEVDYEMFSRLHARLSKQGYLGRWAHKGMGKKDGCATFVLKSLKVLGTCVEEYDDAVPGGQRSGHVAQLFAVSCGSMELAIVNTHLKFDEPDAEAAKAFGLRQARLLCDFVAGSGRPVVLCGDFNAEHGGGVMSAFAKRGFVDAHPREYHTAVFNGRPQKIDYILLGPSLVATPVATKWLAPEQPLPSADEPSDHLPLRAFISRAT